MIQTAVYFLDFVWEKLMKKKERLKEKNKTIINFLIYPFSQPLR